MTRRQRRSLQRIYQDVITAFLCFIVGLTVALHCQDMMGRIAGALLLICAVIFARAARREWLITKSACLRVAALSRPQRKKHHQHYT